MRHLGSFIAALVIAPVAWILLAMGQDRSARAFEALRDAPGAVGGLVRPVLLLAAAGLLLGLIGTLRLSPLGAASAGAGYAASYLALLISPERTLALFDRIVPVAGRSVDLAVPLESGSTLLLGALLLVAAVSRQRWRRWPALAGAADDSAPRADAEEERPLGADGLGLGPAERREPFPGDDRAPYVERDAAGDPAGGDEGEGSRTPEPAYPAGRYDALAERQNSGRHAALAGRYDALTERFDSVAARYDTGVSRFGSGSDGQGVSPVHNEPRWQRSEGANQRLT